MVFSKEDTQFPVLESMSCWNFKT